MTKQVQNQHRLMRLHLKKDKSFLRDRITSALITVSNAALETVKDHLNG